MIRVSPPCVLVSDTPLSLHIIVLVRVSFLFTFPLCFRFSKLQYLYAQTFLYNKMFQALMANANRTTFVRRNMLMLTTIGNVMKMVLLHSVDLKALLLVSICVIHQCSMAVLTLLTYNLYLLKMVSHSSNKIVNPTTHL